MKPSFSSLSLSEPLQQVLTELGYESMTPIQEQSIPLLLAGRDVIGQSQTGSGKTAAFSLPLLQKIRLPVREVQALVLCPTRELCTQVATTIRKLGRRLPGLQVLIVSGGQPLRPQAFALDKGVHIVVGTPGRVMDHLGRQTLDLSRLATVVLDEADRMLDMGFAEDMEEILKTTPKARQTALFSATYPASIASLSKAYQKAAEHVVIETAAADEPLIQQSYCEVEADHKLETLMWLLKKHQPQSAMVFCNQKVTVNVLVSHLEKAGLSVGALHGDLEQFDRDQVLTQFRNQSVRVLVATDVAARGIDVTDLDLVVNFDLPLKPESYVHRIGRTGRAGQKGRSIALVTKREQRKWQTIEEFMGQTVQKEELPSLKQITDEGAKKFHQSETQWATLAISAGRKDKLRPGDILGALTGEAGRLKADDVGKIDIQDHIAYVAVARSVAQVALERLRDGRIKGRKLYVDLI